MLLRRYCNAEESHLTTDELLEVSGVAGLEQEEHLRAKQCEAKQAAGSSRWMPVQKT